MPLASTKARCSDCLRSRASLSRQLSRSLNAIGGTSLHGTASPSSHVNYRYLSRPQLVTRLTETHHRLRLSIKETERLKKKISAAVLKKGLQVDDEVHTGLLDIMRKESQTIITTHSPDSFQRTFWEQQHVKFQRHVLASINDTILSALTAQV